MNEKYDRLSPQRKSVVDAVTKNLEAGAGIWKPGWTVRGCPVSAVTGKRYRGLNNVHLTLLSMAAGYSDNRWVTFRQMENKGWSFKRDGNGNSLAKGRGALIEFFELRDRRTGLPLDRSLLDSLSAAEKTAYCRENVLPVRRHYHVFNGDLVNGIPERTKASPKTDAPVEGAEKTIRYWDRHQARIIHGGGQAYYVPDRDEIHLPRRDLFDSFQEYYLTAGHEMSHSTGHPSRLNRPMSTDIRSPEYALEELRAEISSMFLAQNWGMDRTGAGAENNTAYIGSWLNEIKNDPDVLFTAIGDADRIANYITEKAAVFYAAPAETPAPEAETPAPEPPAPVPGDFPGEESLTKMEDRDLVERALAGRYGKTFGTLYEGGSLTGDEARDERGLMSRIAVLARGDRDKVLRVFRSSGQYRKEKGEEHYASLLDEAMSFASRYAGPPSRYGRKRRVVKQK